LIGWSTALLQNIGIHPDVKENLGRCKVIAGADFDKETGELKNDQPTSLIADRLYIRNELNDIMQEQRLRFAIRRLDVYAPCAVLHGICLVDGPGKTCVIS